MRPRRRRIKRARQARLRSLKRMYEHAVFLSREIADGRYEWTMTEVARDDGIIVLPPDTDASGRWVRAPIPPKPTTATGLRRWRHRYGFHEAMGWVK